MTAPSSFGGSAASATIDRMIREARQDPALSSRLNVANLIESFVENGSSSTAAYLEGETLDSIAEDVVDSLRTLSISRDLCKEYCDKLVGYRHADELHRLRKGGYVRWIRADLPDQLTRGGILVDIRFGDSGPNIVCRTPSGKFIQYRFNECLTYQKLTEDEQLILAIYSSSR